MWCVQSSRQNCLHCKPALQGRRNSSEGVASADECVCSPIKLGELCVVAMRFPNSRPFLPASKSHRDLSRVASVALICLSSSPPCCLEARCSSAQTEVLNQSNNLIHPLVVTHDLFAHRKPPLEIALEMLGQKSDTESVVPEEVSEQGSIQAVCLEWGEQGFHR